MKPSQRVTLALVAADLGLFAVFFGLALFNYSASNIIPKFTLGWEIATAAVDFFRWMPPLHFLVAILVVASLRDEGEGLVVKVAVPAVVLSAALAAAALLLGPVLEGRIESSKGASRRFMEALETVKTALKAENAPAARSAYLILEAIDRDDFRIEEQGRILANLEVKVKEESRNAKALASGESAGRPGDAKAADAAAAKTAWEKAQDFAKKGDWYNAHWQATLASSSIPEAKRLAARAMEELETAAGSSPTDKEEAAFFATKLRGYGLLRQEDFIGAYRIFDQLSKEGYGRDAEVLRYLGESRAGVELTSFWRDEAYAASEVANLGRLFLRFAATEKEGGGERVLVAREVAHESGAAYFFDLEVLEARSDGTALLISAPWAKLAAGRLYLVAADRDNPGTAWRPVASELSATMPAGASLGEGRPVKAPSSLELALGDEELWRFAAAQSNPGSLPIGPAWTALASAEKMGIDPRPLLLELLRRLGIPFATFGAAAIGLLFGLRFRVGPGGPGGLPLPAIPFIAGLTALGGYLIGRLDALASAWCAGLLPGPGAIGLSAGMRALLILAAAILAVGASRDSSSAGHDLDSRGH